MTAPVPPDPIASEGYEEAVAACPNCGSEQVGAYCAGCGQKRQPLRQPVHRFLGESITEYFGIDGRLWRTLSLLLFRPGRLTQAYFEGRRVGYLRPLRIYLTTTLLFFFLLSILDPVGELESRFGWGVTADTTVTVEAQIARIDSALARYERDELVQAQAIDSLRRQVDSLRIVRTGEVGTDDPLADLLDDLEDEQSDLNRLRDRTGRRQILAWQREQLQDWPPDSTINPRDLERAALLLFNDPTLGDFNSGLPEWLPRSRSFRQMQEARSSEEMGRAVLDYARATIGQLPTVMFLLLPFFAVILKGIYGHRRWRTLTHPLRVLLARVSRRPAPRMPATTWFYSEHLVFALHSHAFAFLVFAVIAMLVGFGGGAGWTVTLSTILALWIPVYFFIAQKRVYGEGWVKTALKALILGWVYGWMLLLLGLALAFLLAAIGG